MSRSIRKKLPSPSKIGGPGAPVAGNGRPRAHFGDIMAPKTRSAVMARIRGADTGIERNLASALEAAGLAWRGHVPDLPGRPDFVFVEQRVAVFVDGDFWHGWRFPTWRHRLSEKWEAKIAATRARDARNHRQLRRRGWRVLRLWAHALEDDLAGCVVRVLSLVRTPLGF